MYIYDTISFPALVGSGPVAVFTAWEWTVASTGCLGIWYTVMVFRPVSI